MTICWAFGKAQSRETIVIDPDLARHGPKSLWLPALLATVSLVGTLILAMQPPRAGPVAAIFPPWWDADRAVQAAAAAGRVVRLGAVPFVVVVMPDRDDALERLRQSGAWFSLDPQGLGACTGA